METFLILVGGIVLAAGVVYAIMVGGCALFLWAIGYRGGGRLW